MVCAADIAVDVVLRINEFLNTKPVGAVVINADIRPNIDPTCPQQKQRANEIYEAISSDGMIPFTGADAKWLVRFNAALYYSNEGNS